ncbi:hypothetical protein WQQ_39040 [Hydrocarboniphaga effusa AP103]|uniref:Uncharacterized protein n=1 Tax=Hydrocarboniphaga effusa AP103 TaxID=1172194 RepID=I7ZA32_9GAMM|nr:hypothetical protein WQQ_39040 [Hydrocarboniphaga effusa AP103]
MPFFVGAMPKRETERDHAMAVIAVTLEVGADDDFPGFKQVG